MKVGVLCEFSGTVRDAFIRKGHDAISCDLLPTEAPGPHITGDCLQQDWSGFDLLICHPPCTYLCSSGLHRNKGDQSRQLKTIEAVAFVETLMHIDCERIAIENPIGCLSTRIRKPEQIIQPYQYGHDASKSTCLWLKNLQPLTFTRCVNPRIAWQEGKPYMRWDNQTDSGQNRLGPSEDRWAKRSLTYPGIAEAMADQWGEQQLEATA